jgi:hypothetical protein
MINGTYKIEMKTLMGKKYGRLTLQEKENSLSGDIDILGHDNEIHGVILIDGSCRFSGEFITPVRNIEFLAEGSVDEKKVDLLVHTERYSIPVFGEIEIILEKGGER